MKPQILLSLVFSSLIGFSAASVNNSPAPRDQAAFINDLNIRKPTVQTVSQSITTAIHYVVRRQDGQPQAGAPDSGSGPGTGGQGQQPEKPKPTHDPIPTLAPSDSDSGSRGNGGQIGAIIGGVFAGIIGLILVVCVIKGRRARMEAQEEEEEEYEMRKQRRRGRR
ncbi:hypothetical protein QR685DRAFT_580568 [Neurospora intermedia]|uniref:Mid2 domain-containing protein n=1 Tax=Neurospora intermedia TaxID=5142 RepID=A0ABR3D1C7_NEUIN